MPTVGIHQTRSGYYVSVKAWMASLRRFVHMSVTFDALNGSFDLVCPEDDRFNRSFRDSIQMLRHICSQVFARGVGGYNNRLREQE